MKKNGAGISSKAALPNSRGFLCIGNTASGTCPSLRIPVLGVHSETCVPGCHWLMFCFVLYLFGSIQESHTHLAIFLSSLKLSVTCSVFPWCSFSALEALQCVLPALICKFVELWQYLTPMQQLTCLKKSKNKSTWIPLVSTLIFV